MEILSLENVENSNLKHTSIRLQSMQVTVRPEVNKIILFNKAIPKGSNYIIPPTLPLWEEEHGKFI